MKNFNSLQWKLVFIFIAITLFLMIFIFVALNYQVNSIFYKNFIESVKKDFDLWSSNLPENPTSEEIISALDENKNYIFAFKTSDTLSVTLIDRRSKNFLFSSDKLRNEDEFKMHVLSSENALRVIAGDEEGNIPKMMDYHNRQYYDYARIKGDFLVYFIYDREAWSMVVEEFSRIIMLITVFALIITIFLGYILSRTITAPLFDLMKKARAIAEGNFGSMLIIKSEDEIGQLTKTFNHMSMELHNTLNEIAGEKSKIETILNYMTDGLIAFDLSGRVIHINPPALRLLEINSFDDNFYDFCSRYKIDITLEDLLYIESYSGTERQIKLEDTSLKVCFAVFKNTEKKVEGVLIVLQDITQQERLEQMRKEFVANVSHELRTPLASIRLYSEALLDGGTTVEQTSNFLQKINTESTRMAKIADDLLQLSSFDNKKAKFNVKPINISKVVKETVESVRIVAENKKQRLECFEVGSIPQIEGDYDKLRQVMTNIIGNAVKYTPDDGEVTVYIGSMLSSVYIKVCDNGIGIKEEDQKRLFERFYRVDKARSREMGGTGLGLSIAKEITEAHGGSISIKSEYGKGTEIQLTLPLSYKGTF